MRTWNLFRHVAAAGLLFIHFPIAEAQGLPSLNNTYQITALGMSVSYPDGWSVAQATGNTWVVMNVPVDQQDTGMPTVRIGIGSSIRTDHTDAVNQLQEFANESPTRPTFLAIGGWPGMQRVQTVPRPQPGEEPLFADKMMIQITTAVAAGTLLVRLEARLPSNTDSLTQQIVLAIGQSLTFSTTIQGAQVNAELKKLRSAPKRVGPPKGAAAPPIATPSGTGAKDAALSIGTKLKPLLLGAGSPIFPSVQLFSNGELEVAVSNDGKNIVIGRQSAFVTSNDGGQTFPFSGNLPVNDGDSSLAFGQSGNFYHAALACFGSGCASPCPANSTCVETASSTNNAQSFGALVNAVVCPNSGGGACSVDQEHIAADRFIAGGSGDRVYVGVRNCLGGCGGNSFVSCSPDSGATWAPPLALEGGSDFPRVAVGQDGFFYVVFRNGGNIRIDKFNACTTSAAQMTRAAGGFPKTVSGFNDIAGCEAPGGFPGLDRCNDGNVLSSPVPAVDDTNANHIYVSWATNTAANNENVQVADSINGGVNWRAPVTVNGGGAGRRFMPWVCPSGGNAFVTWYDRRNATGVDNSLTDYFAASAGLNAGNLVANNDEFQISTTSDSQCRLWPSVPRSPNDSENCSIQPQNAGRCSVTTSIRCDFAGGDGTQCPGGETCQTGGGGPKYGDYNGNACVLGRLYTVFATAAGGSASVIDRFQSFVVSSTSTTLTYNGPVAQDYHDDVTFSATLTLSGTSSGVAGQTITFTLGVQNCMGTTNSSGTATCSLTPITQTPGAYTITASFAGSGNYQASSSGPIPFTITREETTLTYTGDTIVGNGNTAHMSAVLREDGVVPISGRNVVFTLGTGGGAQTCNGTTNGAGIAACTIVVNQPPGPQPIAANFAGDAFYLPSTANATLVVPAPPTITKAFADSQVEVFFGFTRLTFTIANPPVNPIPLTGIAFTDTLPAGLIVLAPDNGLTGTCGGGTITAVPASSTISLSGATLAPNGTCTFSVLVNGAAIGVQNNSTSPITSTTGGGLTGIPATASIPVVFTEFFWFFAEDVP